MDIPSINELLKQCEIYQDILINGQLYKKGIRNCEDRYNYIKSLISISNRQFTVLDIGANFGYYSLKIAEEFPNSYVIMIQNGIEAQVLKEICKYNTNINDRLCLLNITANSTNMKSLSECEHFDYIICNNVLHHMPDYKEVYEILKKMCKYLIIETPPPEDNLSCGQPYLDYIYNIVNLECSIKSGITFQRHTNKSTYSNMYLLKFSELVNKELAYYNAPKQEKKYIHLIKDDERVFIKKNKDYKIQQPYIYGINLLTFVSLNGIYPTKNIIIDKISIDKIHTNYKFDNTLRDINTWNLLLNDKIFLIDTDNNLDGYNDYDDNLQLNNIKKFLQNNLI
jgi:SAM-dependent methyltransferase